MALAVIRMLCALYRVDVTLTSLIVLRKVHYVWDIL